MNPKTASLIVFASLCVAALPAAAGNTPQQQRMAECSTKNKGLTGDAYKSAQKACLSGTASTGNAQQERMKKCNADAAAKQLSGDARKTFMSSCLKAS